MPAVLIALALAAAALAAETPADPLLLFGWLQNEQAHPVGGYFAVPPRKRPGTLRVGVFGCSINYGHEAAPGHDMPSFLRRRFAAEGYHDVEIVNFGVGAFGFHQSFLLWRELAGAYDLDHVAAYWMPEYDRRDSTFMFHDYEPRAHPHARFVLDGAGVRLMEPAGRSIQEAVRLYHAALPPWRYWRYDERAPLPLRRWSSRTVGSRWNPFYYLRGAAARSEQREIGRRLVAQMAAGRASVLLFSDEAEAAPALAAMTEGTRARWMTIPSGDHRPELELAPLRHPSALRHSHRADALFSFLTGRRSSASRRLRLEPLVSLEQAADPGPLAGWSDGRLYAAGRPLARLVAEGPPPRRDLEPFDPKAAGLQSVLAYRSGASREFLFLSWSRPWPARSPVELRLRRGRRWTSRAVGEVLSADARVGRAATPDGVLEGLIWEEPADEAELVVGGQPVLRGPAVRLRSGWSARFVPVPGLRRLRLRAASGDYADPAALPPEGLAGFSSRDGKVRAPAARYVVERAVLAVPANDAPIYRKRPGS